MVAPEHVLDAVQRIEDRGQQAFLEGCQLVHQQVVAPLENEIAQGQELLIVDAAVFQAGSVLRPAQGQERPAAFPGIFDERSRGAVTPDRVQRVDLQWGDIKLKMRLQLGDHQPHQGVHRNQPAGLETHFDNRAPLRKAQLHHLLVEAQLGRTLIFDQHFYRQAGVFAVF